MRANAKMTKYLVCAEVSSYSASRARTPYAATVSRYSQMSWNVELPVSLPFRQRECCGKVIEKVAAGDGFGAEGQNVG